MNKVKSFIQLIVANKLVNKSLHMINVTVLGIASSNRLFSILYHILFFHTYSREQHAILKGRYRHYASLKRNTKSRSALRRNVHRIEKGLIMEPPKKTFAHHYIENTVSTYAQAALQYQNKTGDIDCSELFWAHDVLRKYFDKIELNKTTADLKKRFESIEITCDLKSENKSPYMHQDLEKSDVTYQQLLKLSEQRRSVRWFEQRPVPRELIDKALLIARQSPSACNRLPYEYRFFDEPDLVQKVATIPFGAAGYAHNIPSIAVLTGTQSSYFSARDRHVVYIDASLSAMAFMLALETLGLSSSVINWPDFEPVEIKMQKTLHLSTDERPIMLIAIGYARSDGGIPYSQKKDLDSLRSFNKLRHDS